MSKTRDGDNLLNGSPQCLGRLLELFRVDRARVNHEHATRTQQG